MGDAAAGTIAAKALRSVDRRHRDPRRDRRRWSRCSEIAPRQGGRHRGRLCQRAFAQPFVIDKEEQLVLPVKASKRAAHGGRTGSA